MILAELSTKSRKAAEGEENQSALLAPQLSFSKSRMAFDAHRPPPTKSSQSQSLAQRAFSCLSISTLSNRLSQADALPPADCRIAELMGRDCSCRCGRPERCFQYMAVRSAIHFRPYRTAGIQRLAAKLQFAAPGIDLHQGESQR